MKLEVIRFLFWPFCEDQEFDQKWIRWNFKPGELYVRITEKNAITKKEK